MQTIALADHGCGKSHSRPTGADGFPVHTWRLDCDPCERHLFSGPKRIKKHTASGGALEWEDSHDPMWSRTIEGIPQTPDEEKAKHAYEIRGSAERDQLQTALLMKLAGYGEDSIPGPLELGITGAWASPGNLAATRLCKMGHINASGSKFCSTCAADLNEKPDFLKPAVDPGFQGELSLYEDESTEELRSFCKSRDLRFDGDRKALASRLQDNDRERFGLTVRDGV